ncbi:MAG: AccI family restriction endonuclease [Bacteroidales bacterium]|nr:AccI family restriction endonuclease [Bacteroidales bacterium]
MKTYKDSINEICSNIHTGLVDFSEPRERASIPTQASSEFITNKQQGDWAEDVLFRAINENSENLVAVRYGKSDDLVAGDVGFEKFFNNYQEELDTIGKRPDLLLFNKADFDPGLGLDISMKDSNEICSYVSKAIAAIEVRSSAFLINKYTEETNRVLQENIDKAISLRNKILSEYLDVLEQKRPELVPLLRQLDDVSVRSLNFKTPTWRSSSRLQELSSLLSEIKKCLKVIQKRNSLSITPKVEDLKVVHKWIQTYDVPHYYVQVFFDRIYGMSFQHILELIANPALEDEKYFIEQDSKNQNKTTIKIPSQDGICLAGAVTEPNHHSVRKELNKGRLLFYVKFDGGEAFLDKENFEKLFDCSL